MTRIAIAAALAPILALAAQAGAWTLDNDLSNLSYVTMKNGETAEANLLPDLSGHVAENGDATIEINLFSVETFIDIRNERMREFLFDTENFPLATVTARIDMDGFAGMEPGETRAEDFELTVETHGKQASYEAQAWVTRAGDGKVVVDSRQPIIVYAGDFGYEDGVADLKEIAGLDSIQPAVPVDFHLVFVR